MTFAYKKINRIIQCTANPFKSNPSLKEMSTDKKGRTSKMETKRKIILASESKISDKNKVFSENMEVSIKDRKDRRLSYDRRQFSYNMFIPELRSGKSRRSRLDRRRKPRKLN